ncbi:MAG TPA: mandelate racemase/muconate lactonizing enzyme family protein, partial [Thermosynergistes sp.]|nr:mandelate racemase/muconate lactonizing enzyme family protein [Thermosynergistes sp.]
MRITAVDSFVLHVPVTGGHIEDSSHKVDRWGVPMARIETNEGITGFGYTGTHCHLPTDRLIAECIKEA